MNIDLTKLDVLGPLKIGSHSDPSAGACVMEAVAFVAGEPWSDHPECVSPVIGAFARTWNDALPSDAERDRLLKPLIPKVLNTRADSATEDRRAYLALDWLIRTHVPAWLRLAKMSDHADRVAGLAPIVDTATAVAAAPIVQAAWDAVGDAVGDAALDAAWDAARDAARAAAGAAARYAAWDAASAATRAAASAATRAAAGAAASAAAWDALSETSSQLQLSAIELVERMAALRSPT